jgi:MFS family permease
MNLILVMNRTIKLLMLSDIFVVTGFGLIEPIIAIFIKENLIGGTIFAAGLASTLFLIVKSIIQIPFSKYVDSHRHKINFLIFGTFIISIIPFIYIFSTHIYHIFLAQILYGVGAALAYPTWLSLWSTHLDSHHEAFEWSIYSTSVGLGAALTAMVGAAIADIFGFQLTFIVVGILSIMGCLVLFGLEKKNHLEKILHLHYHKRRKLTHHKRI